MTTTNHHNNHASASLLDPLKVLLGPELVQHLHEHSHLLVVGAGGIGCELLKNLALSGFMRLTIVDLDTIDVSNLNRQLLFRRPHVGHPKCTTAAQVAQQMAISSMSSSNNNNNDSKKVDYQALHANICNSGTFHVPFLKQFDLVLNALDNVTARRRVNRLCLAAQVPLIEAGTTGYLGQATCIVAQQSACYECKTVETPKVYPICTIRATPSQPVHTIVWSKELYKLLFVAPGPDNKEPKDSMLYEDKSVDGGNSTYMNTVYQLRALLHNDQTSESDMDQVQALTATLVQNLYRDEILKQLELDRYKTALKTPVPLSATDTHNVQAADAPTLQPTYRSTDIDGWSTPAGCVAELQAVLRQVLVSRTESTSTQFPEEFDKDHDGAMRFITAASNLRNQVFGIEPIQSVYSAKGIAGNIIPAIATTNAIAAGLQILQVYNILKVQLHNKQLPDNQEKASIADACFHCSINKFASAKKGTIIMANALEKPNPHCFVCRQGMVELVLNTNTWTLQTFIGRILQQALGLQEPSIEVNGDLIWEQGEDSDQAMFEVNSSKLLSKLPAGGIGHGTIVRVDDFTQQLEFTLHISHQESFPAPKDGEPGGTTAEELPFLLKKGAQKTAATATTNGNKVAAAEATKEDDDDDSFCQVVTNNKRKTEDVEDVAEPKRRKVVETSVADKEVILVED